MLTTGRSGGVKDIEWTGRQPGEQAVRGNHRTEVGAGVTGTG